MALALVDATDLARWAERQDSQARLPQVLRRLILSTARGVRRLSFAAGEGVFLAGWDGIADVERGNAFVPQGVSVWEVGTSGRIRAKADSDFRKRTSDPGHVSPEEASFVFVTPRRWSGKQDWVVETNAEGVWREVRAYDADDLEAWLELSPATHAWISSQLGRDPVHYESLHQFWDEWSRATRPSLKPEVVLAGRDKAVDELRQWLAGEGTGLTVHADSKEEAMAFIASTILKLPSKDAEGLLSRALIVRSEQAWRQVSQGELPLLLFPTLDAINGARALEMGHRIIVPSEGIAPSGALKLPRLRRDGLEKALQEAGIAMERAQELATVGRRSLGALRRRLAVGPGLASPEWVSAEAAEDILPAVLADAWDEQLAGDKTVLAYLARRPYGDHNRSLNRWVTAPDPPLRRTGSKWLVASKEDSWHLLARFLTSEDLERFRVQALEVIGAPDPARTLPQDQRWAAGIYGKSRPHSDLLRSGLASTLALMAARSDQVHLGHNASGQEHSTRVVARLLADANKSAAGDGWAALADVLPLLAEASPDTFLEACEEGLRGGKPLLRLFEDGEHTSVLFSRATHAGLLWALETVAWQSEYLARSSLILGLLADEDPGGRWSNRPANSLREIFLPWHPQTAASLDRRLAVLDLLRSRTPAVAFDLLVALLPKAHERARPTATPRWREWKPEGNPVVTYGELFRAYDEILSRLLLDAAMDGVRWAALLGRLGNLPEEQRERVTASLENLEIESFSEDNRAAIRDALRDLVGRHLRFPNAPWAAPGRLVDRLIDLHRRLEPEDAFERYAPLFLRRPKLMKRVAGDWDQVEAALRDAQLNAIKEAYQQGGTQYLHEMARIVERPNLLGYLIGRSEVLGGDEQVTFLRTAFEGHLSSPECGQGFVSGMFQECGWNWAEEIIDGEVLKWPAGNQAKFLLALPPCGKTWNWLDQMSPDASGDYWRGVFIFGIDDTSDYQRATEKLLSNNLPHTAVALLGHCVGHRGWNAPVNIAVRALEVSARSPMESTQDWGSFAYDVERLLDYLEASSDVEPTTLAGLEWAYLPLLRDGDRPPRLLHDELASNPAFFVTVVSAAYRARHEEPRDLSEADEARAMLSHHLLDSWKTVPGSLSDNSIDAQILSAWVDNARSALAEFDRAVIGDQLIGKVLRYGPTEYLEGQEYWPPRPVRDLIERIASRDLELGIKIEITNSRGVTTRSPTDGGEQERTLAEQYRNYSHRVSDLWPRTAAMLREIANSYEAEARDHDARGELNQDLW